MFIRKLKNFLNMIRKYKQCYSERKKLQDKDFTIISNNCWGGFIYQYYGLKYYTPTVGLFFIGRDYVKFCKDIKHYVSQKLKFISFEESKNYEIIKRDNRYPVAQLDDIEIYFMHYKTEEEAAEKWYRRCERINWDNMIYKISQREGYKKKDIEDFMQLDIGRKVCFSYDEVEGSVLVKELEGYKGDEMELLNDYFDFRKILNKDIRKQ